MFSLFVVSDQPQLGLQSRRYNRIVTPAIQTKFIQLPWHDLLAMDRKGGAIAWTKASSIMNGESSCRPLFNERASSIVFAIEIEPLVSVAACSLLFHCQITRSMVYSKANVIVF